MDNSEKLLMGSVKCMGGELVIKILCKLTNVVYSMQIKPVENWVYSAAGDAVRLLGNMLVDLADVIIHDWEDLVTLIIVSLAIKLRLIDIDEQVGVRVQDSKLVLVKQLDNDLVNELVISPFTTLVLEQVVELIIEVVVDIVCKWVVKLMQESVGKLSWKLAVEVNEILVKKLKVNAVRKLVLK